MTLYKDDPRDFPVKTVEEPRHFHLPDSGCCSHPDCLAKFDEHGARKGRKTVGDGMSDSDDHREEKARRREAKDKKVTDVKALVYQIKEIEDELRQNEINMRGRREQLARLTEQLEKFCG